MKKKIVITAALFGLTAIVFGAFGAHALKQVLNSAQLSSFETGVRYQMYHGLLLLFIDTTYSISTKYKNRIYYLITIGTILFSGSIYLLATNALTTFDFKSIGFITPIGGLLLVLGWFSLLLNVIKGNDDLPY